MEEFKVSGSGTVPSGEYGKIKMSGSGKLNGLIVCEELSCAGSVSGEAEIRCSGAVTVSGSGHITGNIQAEKISVSGSFSAGKCQVKEEARVAGSARFDEDFKCRQGKISGSLHVKGGMEAEELVIKGRLNCEGLINAEKLDVEFESGFSAESIGGGTIMIYPRSRVKTKLKRLPLLSSILGAAGANSAVVSGAIEGDTVALEGVKAENVTGRVVAIGAGCQIGFVQYSESIEISPDAKVDKYEKVG